MDKALEIRGVTKRFGPVVANDHIDLSIGQGEIHAILGENGAGKSTLMNILYGLYQPDAGSIAVYGKSVEIRSPRDAAALGIQMVHQHFMLGLPFTVAENLILGYEPLMGGWFLDQRKAEKIVRGLSKQYGLEVDPKSRIENLSVGEMQRVEILKTLYRQANILILDEPTAVLTPIETHDLFKVMRRLKEERKTVIFITHKLREVMEIADRVTVLRHGRVVGSHSINEVNEASLVEMMVGKLVQPISTNEESLPKAPILQVDNVWLSDPHRKIDVLRGITLDVRAGEILGIAGVEGNGQSELVEALIGLLTPKRGSIRLNGKELLRQSPRQIMQAGVACIHEDRQAKGLIADFSVSENLILGDHYYPPYCRNLMLQNKVITETTAQLIKAFNIHPPNPKLPARALSGGNQQKLILARELREKDVKLLIACQPSRGLDVNATIFVHQMLRKIRSKGCAVLLISADLDEIKALSDRIAVMYRGEIVALGAKESFSDAELGSLMLTGHKPTLAETTANDS